jgi:hypothetical protein
MRMILLAGVISMAAVTAQAESSIDAVTTSSESTSIDRISCPSCAPLKTEKEEEPELVLKPGTQKVELRKVNGEMKVFRTEAWLGGSPVTYVSKASTDLIDMKSAEVVPAGDHKVEPVIIDNSTTSAVSADMSGGASTTVEMPKAAKQFNPQDMQLRLN